MALPQFDTPDEPAIAITREAGTGLHITWTDGFQSFFHFIWLRDCCHCADCGDCYSSKRFLVPCDLDLNVRPGAVDIAPDGKLAITWAPDNHQSAYDSAWLRHNSYDAEIRQTRRHKPTLWDSTVSSDLPSVDYQTAVRDEATRLTLYRKLRDYGFVVLCGGPAEPDSVAEVASLVGDLGESAYDKIFDLSPSSKVRTMGNTTRPVPPHTDEPFRYSPPGVMVLGCVRMADDGGDTVLVDGFHLAEIMRNDHPEQFELLCNLSQTFIRRHNGSLDQETRVPMFATDDEGEVCGVRIHTRSAGPLDLPVEQVEPYYAAHHRLTQLMMADENQLHIRLQPGYAVLFDNHRILHARTHFTDPNRFLQICSVPREQFHECLRLLLAEQGYVNEARMVLPAGAIR